MNISKYPFRNSSFFFMFLRLVYSVSNLQLFLILVNNTDNISLLTDNCDLKAILIWNVTMLLLHCRYF